MQHLPPFPKEKNWVYLDACYNSLLVEQTRFITSFGLGYNDNGVIVIIWALHY